MTATALDGTTHSVEVQASTLYEAAASAMNVFREQGWGAEALTPRAVLTVEVRPPATVHEVPLKAVEQWLRSPSPSPKEFAAKRKAGAG